MKLFFFLILSFSFLFSSPAFFEIDFRKDDPERLLSSFSGISVCEPEHGRWSLGNPNGGAEISNKEIQLISHIALSGSIKVSFHYMISEWNKNKPIAFSIGGCTKTFSTNDAYSIQTASLAFELGASELYQMSIAGFDPVIPGEDQRAIGMLLRTLRVEFINSSTDSKRYCTGLMLNRYFNDEYYRSNYSSSVSEGQRPLDHFFGNNFDVNLFPSHTDQNSWFNTTVYVRTFDCNGKNPLWDYCEQSALNVSADAETIHVYANNEDQMLRVWLATESLLRLNKYNVTLHLSPDIADNLERFDWQQKRGLQIRKDNVHKKSFYKSPFLKMNLDGIIYPEYQWNSSVSRHPFNNNFICHRTYGYTKWWNDGKIDPLRVNVFSHCNEPLAYAPDAGYLDFCRYVLRISSGFDLIFFPYQLSSNVRIIPGHLFSWVDETPDHKEYSVSFLLSLGTNGLEEAYKPGFLYHHRKDIWNMEEEIKKILLYCIFCIYKKHR